MMRLFKLFWGLLFRLFPCPVRLGLRKVGNPGRSSPVLVTCNFFTTVKRLTRALRGLDLWLLVAESHGVNVWCAAGGGEFNTHSVVSAVKTSGIADMVDHRTMVLPPLGAPGINAHEVARETGWTVMWGPVRAAEIPRYLAQGMRRDESMKRVTYRWLERLDTALGSLFIVYLLTAVGFLAFGRQLLLDYLAVGAGAFLFFMLACPWLPGRHGLTKAILPEVALALAAVATLLLQGNVLNRVRPDLIIAMVMLAVYSAELGGMAPTMRSDLDPFLARFGVGALGKVAWASTVRVDLLIGTRTLSYHPEKCVACGSCAEVCPQGVWEIADNKRAVLARKEDCTACRACIVQCKGAAILAEPAD
jgi:NAD-dependent dihydropyrimidine dehydrogenase PreA subunit